MNTTVKQSLQPYLHFQDNCRDAMQFYKTIFGGKLEVMIIGESPAREHFPKELYNQVPHASLINGDFYLMASDMCGQGELKQGNSVQLNINCTSKEHIEALYQKLSEGGEIIQKLEKQFWGSLFAIVIDQYGVRWMLSFDEE
jgi:PhnB protein